MNNYKGDIDTNRTDSFSSLYVIISKIGLGCITYFMVGLLISLIYVLSDMDYFTLNGQFRNQRFFTDDGYYYTKQLVIIYGLFAFILTMFIGPVGIIPCIIWSWLLTISYISMSVYMNSTNPDKYNKLLIRFIGFVSFVSHSLLCNFIFYLFYPMNSMFSSYIYDYDIKLTNSNNSNNKHNINSTHNNSRSSYTFYRIISFMGGYFIGCSLLSFVLSIKTDMRDSLYPINNHNNNMKLLFAMLIASSISMLTSLLLSFQFVYEYIIKIKLLYKIGNTNDTNSNYNSNITNSHNDLIDKSRYMLDSGTFVWFPINKHTNNVISKNFHTIIDIEMLFVWILNPFIITLIPYTIPSHFQFRKQSYIHKLLFSLIFIIIFMFLNDDLIFSYLYPNEYMNTTLFNIVYSNQYIQLKDDHLYLNPASMSNNYNINCGFNNINKINILSTYESSKNFVLYPHFDNVWDFLDNENLLLSSYIYEVIRLLYISSSFNIDINSYIYYTYSMNSLSFTKQSNTDRNEFSIYYYDEYDYDMMSALLNPIDTLFNYIINISDFLFKLDSFYCKYKNDFFLHKHNQYDSYIIGNAILPIKNNCKLSITFIFKTLYNMLLTNNENVLSNTQTIQTNIFSRVESKYVNSLVLSLTSAAILKNHKIIMSMWYEYTKKGLVILEFLKTTKSCKCYSILKLKMRFPQYIYILLYTDPVDLNPYYIFDEKSMSNETGNYICLCLIIIYKLRPNVLSCFRYLLDVILNIPYTSGRRFDKNGYNDTNELVMTKLILIVFDILDEIIELMKKGLIVVSKNPCYCIRFWDPYYRYITNIIIYISSLLENIFTDDIKTIKNKYNSILNLMSIILYYKYDIGIKGSVTIPLIPLESLCKPTFKTFCKCTCDKKDATECCCIICKIYKIICLTICFGCQLCCIYCNEQCQCHQLVDNKCQCNEPPKLKSKIKIIVSFDLRFLFNILPSFINLNLSSSVELEISTQSVEMPCPCKQICIAIKCIKDCNGDDGCSTLCRVINSLCDGLLNCNGRVGKCVCHEICEKIQRSSIECRNGLKEICKSIISKFSKSCTKEKKCCCKIAVNTVYLLYKASKLVSWYFENESKIESLAYNQQINTENRKTLKGINIKNCRNFLQTSKNNRICDTMCNNERITICGNGNFNNNGNVYIYNNKKEDTTLKYGNHKLKQSRIIIALGLIFLILCLRMSFDIDDNNNIYKSNNKLIRQNIENNNLLGSIYNIFVNNNMPQENNQHGEYNIQDNSNINNDQTDNNNSNIKQNKMIYFLNMLVSLTSALYMNIVIRNLYDTLRLEYDIWSYLINMILMTGMMSSLISKYSVHIFDFIGVLDKYGMNLYKSESFIDYVDKNDTEFIDNISSPVKNMMMYGLFKSMTKDLSSLIRYTDVSTTSSSKTTYSKMKNKLYPYKDMSKPIHRITKYCDKCQHSLCKIHKSVINNFGNEKSIDIVSVLDFLSYTMIHNQMTFINQYESYFSGDELYMVWKLNKFVNNNVFVTEYYRHQTLNKIESDIKQLINGDNKLGSYNLMLLWEIFGENEIRNITLKSMSDINDQQMIQNQRDILESVLYDEYLKDFLKFEEYVCNTYLNTRLVSRSEKLNVNNITEFTNILNKHILDKSTIQHLANIYSKNTHDRKIKSLMLPTVSCNIVGMKDEVIKNIKSYCNDWLKNKLLFCKQMKSLYCEEAVNIAYNTIIDLVDKPGNLYNNIFDLLTNMDLKQMDNIFEKPTDYIPKSIQPICKDCESMSMYYINQYLSESLVNIDRMLRPLGMYLSWNGTPILSKHLHKYGHKY